MADLNSVYKAIVKAHAVATDTEGAEALAQELALLALKALDVFLTVRLNMPKYKVLVQGSVVGCALTHDTALDVQNAWCNDGFDAVLVEEATDVAQD